MDKRPAGPSMDALMAHLDHGWDLLKKNDHTGAENSAQQALALEPDSPEALTLLGAISAAEGDEEEALERYRRAMEADPEYVAPMLYAAELLLSPEGDPDEALRLVEDALELAEEEDDYLDALLLKAEALLGFTDGRADAAAALDELPPVRFSEPSFHLRAAYCLLDLDKLDAADHHVTQALELAPDMADAWHTRGLVCESRHDEAGMVAAWLKVRELDMLDPRPPWAISEDEFEKIAASVVDELPRRIQKLLANVPLLCADVPSIEIVKDGWDPRMLGFFQGVPYPEKAAGVGSGHLDTVLLFQRNIERACQSVEEVHEEIRVTVLHETGHFFGMSEADMERIGLD